MNKFVLRSPVFSNDLLIQLYNSVDPYEYIYNFFYCNDLFKQIIYLSSRLLYNSASDNIKISNKKDKVYINTALSLIKYYKRSCYRCTPFGVSSGVVSGEFSDTNSFNLTNNKIGVKLDGYVVNGIYELISNWSEVQHELLYYPNTTLYKYDKDLRYIERKFEKNAFYFKLCKVGSSTYLQKLLRKAKGGARLAELQGVIEKLGFDKEESDQFIHTIIEEKILLANLPNQITASDFETQLLDMLRKICKYSESERCLNLLHCLEEYILLKYKYIDSFSKGEDSIDYLRQLDSTLATYNPHKNKSAVQVDLFGGTPVTLTKSLQKQTTKQIESLLDFAIEDEIDLNLDNFRKAFSHKYSDSVVPLLEALDPDIGIGFANPTRIKPFLLRQVYSPLATGLKESNFTKWDRFILAKYSACISANHTELVLEEQDIKQFSKSNSSGLYDSAVAGYRLIADSEKAIEEGGFLLDLRYLKIGSAADTFSRFAYNSEIIQELCAELVNIEENLLSYNEINAELVHLSQPRLSNILARPRLRKHEIHIYDFADTTKINVIALSDLYLCVQNDKFVLLSKSLKKIVVPVLTSAHNHSLMTMAIYQFLGSLQKKKFVTTWKWGVLNTLPYLPRVRYGNLILAKARWLLQCEDFVSGAFFDFNKLREYIKVKKIDQFVTLHSHEDADNVLPLNLHNSASLQILSKELLSSKAVILCEDPSEQGKNLIFRNNEGLVPVELHVPLHPSVKPLPDSKHLPDWDSIEFLKYFDSQKKPKLLIPSTKCVYLKLYSESELLDELLSSKLYRWLVWIQKNSNVSHYFFIRYMDPEPHIRLRVFGNEIDLNSLFKSFSEQFSLEIRSQSLVKLQIDTYDRELSRYGNIDVSESIFYHDSIFVLKSLAYLAKNNMLESRWIFAVSGVHNLLNDFGLSLDARKTLLMEMRDFYLNRQTIENRSKMKQDVSRFYREKKSIMVDALENNDSYYNNFLNKISVQRSVEIKKLITNMNEVASDNNVESFVHMHLNRLFNGFANEQEVIIYDLLLLFYRSKNGSALIF